MQIYANEVAIGAFSGETVVTGRGMRLKRTVGSGRKFFSTHNALWCLFTYYGELWFMWSKDESLNNFWYEASRRPFVHS